jgi:hypothetical protein
MMEFDALDFLGVRVIGEAVIEVVRCGNVINLNATMLTLDEKRMAAIVSASGQRQLDSEDLGPTQR